MPDFETLPAASSTVVEQSLAELRELVPEAFRDDDQPDVSALLAHFGLTVPDEGDEVPYTFAWPGLGQARRESIAPTTATLAPDADASVEWDTTGNVIIEGDNLQVLKLLLASYRGRFKLIYIDPPYNTGQTFTYSDRYQVPEVEYLRMSGQVDEAGQALSARIEHGGRKHAPWLTMMLPRLLVARALLRRDGAIIAAIDDNEVHHLRQLMDAIFGEANLVGTFVWEGGRKNDARYVSVGHDYMLAYARDQAHLRAENVRWRVRKRGLKPIYAEFNRLREKHGTDNAAVQRDLGSWYDSLKLDDPSREHKHYRRIDDRGIFFADNMSSPNFRANLKYDWKGYKPPAKGWRYEEKEMKRLDDEGRLLYPAKEDGRISLRRYLHENEEQVLSSVFYRDRRAADQELEDLMGGEVFDFPKDPTILAQLLEATTSGDDLVLDFFAGSGSFGHATLKQNRQDGGRRRYVMVQAPEDTEEKSGAREAGYETISEITLERMRRVGDKMAADRGDTEDLGFRVFRSTPSQLRPSAPAIGSDELTGEDYIQHVLDVNEQPVFAADADPAAALWEVILKGTSYGLSARLEAVGPEDIEMYELKGTGDEADRVVVTLADQLELNVVEGLGLDAQDVFICIKGAMDDNTAMTVGQRCRLVVVERVRSEVSL